MKYVRSLNDPNTADLQLSGGKGANLSRLMALPDVWVPAGFVVTTEAYRAILAQLPTIDKAAPPAQIRHTIQNAILPESLQQELQSALSQYAPGTLFAVRSSATAEDLPDASFAGQQDSYLEIPAEQVPQAVLACFASLYNDRAVAYRCKKGYHVRSIAMAVVVQEIVAAQASGVLFTADPLTSDRLTCVVEAVAGLGEELVSGRKTPQSWRIRQAKITLEGEGAELLSENQLHQLAALGQQIESAFGTPQDIEWCLQDGRFAVVQSRAVTTLFPVPTSPDGFKRFFVSAGHMQMMTDVMLPLGMSFMKLIALFQMVECGGRLFIDITHDMKTYYGKKMIRLKLSAMDPLIHQAVEEVMARKEYLQSIPKGPGSFGSFNNWLPMVKEALRIYHRNDPVDIDAYISRMQGLIKELEERLAPLSGPDALEAIVEDQKNLADVIYDASGFGMVLASQYVIRKIDSLGRQLTGEAHLSNRLSKAVAHNPTSEMGLALSEVADLARERQAVVDYLQSSGPEFSLAALREIVGGQEVADAFETFLEQYGMRATGEIDISKPRFRENPSELVGIILSNIRTLPKGYGAASFAAGQQEMGVLTEELTALATEKWGAGKAKRLRRYISFFRNFLGTREYPKYFWICRYDVYKKSLLREAQRLVELGILRQTEDIFYLYLEELRQVITDAEVDYGMIQQRKENYARFAALTPPRLIFSDGEVPEMGYRKELPPGALNGLGVSAGIVEGRARVISAIGDASIEPGDILVTSFTDPSWTPVFVSIAGLVTEVGGMMTHGAVITREYGLPAVVGVMGATRKIHDGDRIRLDGDRGIVEILVRNAPKNLH